MPGDPRLHVEARIPGEAGQRPRLDVRLTVPAGVSVVMGPSGAGKTTLLTTIAGLVRPEAGRIELSGELLFDAAARVFVRPHRRRVALVFQSLALFPHLLAWENVAYALPRMTSAERRARALQWMSRTRVAHLADRAPATLSGGEAQRVALARALASEPRCLLLDEPFSALDAALRRDLGDELCALVAALNVPALLVTHDAQDAARLGSRVIELDSGRVRAE